MARKHRVAIVGLGVVGSRFLALMSDHERFSVVTAWDRDAGAMESIRAKYPTLDIARDADEAIGAPAADVVYVAVPPLAHKDYVLAAIAADKAVFCEKPLGIDVAESEDLVSRIEASGLSGAVNFVFGSAPGGLLIQDRIVDGAIGEVVAVDIRLHFAEWPRGWQKQAAWLAGRAEGGFVREVLSHFAYLTERLLGPAVLRYGRVRYPDEGGAAETHALAELDCGGVPVTAAGSVGGLGPDRVEYTVWGTKRSYRLDNWYRVFESDGGGWTELLTEIENPAEAAYRSQLDNLADLLDGKANTMPGFRAALSVQKLIEDLLTRG
jgi:1,5-anhydro-D-fructose reductase (1,5-anhydro-D-mannitol-forming)